MRRVKKAILHNGKRDSCPATLRKDITRCIGITRVTSTGCGLRKKSGAAGR